MRHREKGQCKAKLSIGDDFGDNSCTFYCQLRKHHNGNHEEVFTHGGSRKITCIMQWQQVKPTIGELMFKIDMLLQEFKSFIKWEVRWRIEDGRL